MRKLIIPLVALLTLLLVSKAHAHPADMYFHNHTVTLSPGEIQVTWELVPGPMITHVIWHDADQNQDETVSSQEARGWVQPVAEEFTAYFDGIRLDLQLQAIEWPKSIPELRTGDEPIRIHLQADWPVDIIKPHNISLYNQYNSQNSVSWFYVFGEDGITFETPEQEGGVLRVHFELPTMGPTTGQPATWESGRPSMPGVIESLGLGDIAEEAASQSQSQQGVTSILEGLVRTPEISPLFFLAAGIIAILLGALHALSPGHGKTIVAAYLVGSQGKAYHAVVLGALVTLTHTGSVFALGLLTLAVSRHIMPANIFPILELVSGLLIFILGIGLLYPRLWDWQNNRRRERQNQKRPPVVVQSETGGGIRLVINQPIQESGPPHSHDPSSMGYIPKGPPEGSPLAGVSWRSLFALGISGGLVPCPDAIAILLIAVTINRIAFGLSLIVAFSLGLAIVLIAIGIVIVQSKRLFARLEWFDRIAYVVPMLSAIVVLGLGAMLTLAAIRNFEGMLPQIKNFFQIGGQSKFDLQRASVIYTALDDNNHYQLFVVPATGGEAEQITEEGSGIWSYSVSPDGATVIYAASDGTNGTRLWQLIPATRERTQLLACPETSCSGVVWSPNGEKILYGRLVSGSEFTSLGIPSIWWLDPATRDTGPLFQDAQMPGFNPQWSPDGRRLSYTSINPSEIYIYNFHTGSSQSLPTQTGSPVTWSPTGESMLVIDVEMVGELNLPKLFRYDLASKELTRLTGEQPIDENVPSWSRNGEWIAVVRREWGVSTTLRGNQIWLMRPDGSEAHPVSHDIEVTHGPPSWSPDGRYLLYSVRSASLSGTISRINILDIETGQTQEIAAPGNCPTWLLWRELGS
jgi:ABC-type nickel/cobalt efflux system permease component RcnA/Tol biopolymer transport system component